MRILSRAALASVFVVAAASAAAAQAPATAPAPAAKIAVGKWTGTVTPPNEEQVAVTIDVASVNDTVSMTIHAGPHGTFQAESVRVETGRLHFEFQPGPRVVCELSVKDDATYAGECIDERGGIAVMTMTPPARKT